MHHWLKVPRGNGRTKVKHVDLELSTVVRLNAIITNIGICIWLHHGSKNLAGNPTHHWLKVPRKIVGQKFQGEIVTQRSKVLIPNFRL